MANLLGNVSIRGTRSDDGSRYGRAIPSSQQRTGYYSGRTRTGESGNNKTKTGASVPVKYKGTGYYDNARGGFVISSGEGKGTIYITPNRNFVPKDYESKIGGSRASNNLLTDVKIVGTRISDSSTPESIKYGTPVTGGYNSKLGGYVTNSGKFYSTRNPNFVPQEVLVSRQMQGDKSVEVGSKFYLGKDKQGNDKLILLDGSSKKVSGPKPGDMSRQMRQEQEDTEKYGTFQEGLATDFGRKPVSSTLISPMRQEGKIIGYEDTVSQQSIFAGRDAEIKQRSITAIGTGYETEKTNRLINKNKEDSILTFQEGMLLQEQKERPVSFLPTVKPISTKDGIVGYEDSLGMQSIYGRGNIINKKSIEAINLGRYDQVKPKTQAKPTLSQAGDKLRSDIKNDFNIFMTPKARVNGDTLVSSYSPIQQSISGFKNTMVNGMFGFEPAMQNLRKAQVKLTDDILGDINNFTLMKARIEGNTLKGYQTPTQLFGLSLQNSLKYPALFGYGASLRATDIITSVGKVAIYETGGQFVGYKKPPLEDYITTAFVISPALKTLKILKKIPSAAKKISTFGIGAGFAGLGVYEIITAKTREEKAVGVFDAVTGGLFASDGLKGIYTKGQLSALLKSKSSRPLLFDGKLPPSQGIGFKATLIKLAKNKKAQVKVPGKRVMSKAQMRERKSNPNIGYSKAENALILFGKRTTKETRLRLTQDSLTKEVRAKNMNVKTVSTIDYLKGTRELSIQPIESKQRFDLVKSPISQKDRIRQLRTLEQTNIKGLSKEQNTLVQVQLKKMNDFRINVNKGDRFISSGKEQGTKIKYGNLPTSEKGYLSLGTVLDTRNIKGTYQPQIKIKGFRNAKTFIDLRQRLYAKAELIQTQKYQSQLPPFSDIFKPSKGTYPLTKFKIKTNEIVPSKYAAGGEYNPLVSIRQPTITDLILKPREQLKIPSTKNRFSEFGTLFKTKKKSGVVMGLPEGNRFKSFSDLFKTNLKDRKKIIKVNADELKVSVVEEVGNVASLGQQRQRIINLVKIGNIWQITPRGYFVGRQASKTPFGLGVWLKSKIELGFNIVKRGQIANQKATFNLLGTDKKGFFLLGNDKQDMKLIGFKSIKKRKSMSNIISESNIDRKTNTDLFKSSIFSLGGAIKFKDLLLQNEGNKLRFNTEIKIDNIKKYKTDKDSSYRLDSMFKLDLGIKSMSALDSIMKTNKINNNIEQPNSRRKYNPIIPDLFKPLRPEPSRPKPKEKPRPEDPIINIPDWSFIGGAGNKKKKKKKSNSFFFKQGYFPSLEAEQLNIFGKQPKGAGSLELGFRPKLRF